MNILFVIDQFNSHNNGISISTVRFANCLRNEGHDVRIVTTGTPQDNLYIVPERYVPIATCFAHVQGQLFAKPQKKVLKEAIAWCDVAHFIMPWKLSKAGIKVAKKLNKPYTAAFHVQAENVTYNIGLGNNKCAINFVYDWFRNGFYKKIKHIHCPSKFIADELVAHKYKNELHVISNGINENFLPIKSEKPEEFKDKFVITMVGRHSIEKRQDILINAVAKSKYCDKIQLIFAGKGPKTEYYKKLAKKLPNPPEFKSFVQSDLINVLQFSDLYVHASEVEIEAVSCLEAMACGLVPIISNSPISATKQFAIDNKSLFNNGDIDDLATKIDYWIEHEDEKEQYSKKYVEYAQNYNIKTCVAKFEEMLQAAIDDNKNK
ncbi:MAG: glycosyltransferase [Clostridia bacterium]|nr:glycosyltransferase [Clostridia bacterium]